MLDDMEGRKRNIAKLTAAHRHTISGQQRLAVDSTGQLAADPTGQPLGCNHGFYKAWPREQQHRQNLQGTTMSATAGFTPIGRHHKGDRVTG